MKTMFKLTGIGLLALGVLVVIIALASPGSRKPTASPADPLSTVVTSSTTSAIPVQTGPSSQFGTGMYEVGVDVMVGKYRTTGSTVPDGYMSSCYWSKYKNASGSYDAIITGGTVQGPGILTLNKGEFFDTRGTCTWKLSP